MKNEVFSFGAKSSLDADELRLWAKTLIKLMDEGVFSTDEKAKKWIDQQLDEAGVLR